MKKTGIMTDSHSGILENEASKLGIAVLPMPFYIDEKLYREGVDISREEFYEMLRKGADVATSQPSPESVMHMWSAMLQEYEELVYIPISSGLSGSCMTAQAMARRTPMRLFSNGCAPSSAVSSPSSSSVRACPMGLRLAVARSVRVATGACLPMPARTHGLPTSRRKMKVHRPL